MAQIGRYSMLFCKAKTCKHFITDKSGYSLNAGVVTYSSGCGFDARGEDLQITITEDGRCPNFKVDK